MNFTLTCLSISTCGSNFFTASGSFIFSVATATIGDPHADLVGLDFNGDDNPLRVCDSESLFPVLLFSDPVGETPLGYFVWRGVNVFVDFSKVDLFEFVCWGILAVVFIVIGCFHEYCV